MTPTPRGCATALLPIFAALAAGAILLAGCRDEPPARREPAAAVPAAEATPPTPAESAPAEDPPLDLDPDGTSVSGISSGGYMAQQLHVAHSDRFIGAGVIAAGPYDCAGGSLGTAMARCMAAAGQPLVIDELVGAVAEAAAAGRIADPAHLAGDRVWLFRGTLDAQIGPEVAAAGAALYRRLVGPQSVVFVDDFAAAHHFPTLTEGHACDQSQSPYIGACGYDAAGALLEHIYGPLNPPAIEAREALREIEYLEPDNPAGLMARAYLYVPESCASGARCRLHLVLHGCLQSAEKVGTALVEGAGFNRWADTNALVIGYPQVRSIPANPYGCWDWWGYTGPAHATRDGPQVKALMRLVDMLTRTSE